MSHSPNLPFSVAKFAIEGVKEGADNPHLSCPAPPRLLGPQTASPFMSELSFSINPFSLSRSSFSHSHAYVSTSPHPVFDHRSTVSSSASVPNTASISQHVHTLFPNPFLIKRNSFSETNPVVTADPCIDLASSPAFQKVVQPPLLLNNSLPARAQPLGAPAVANSLQSTRKPRKPRQDRILTPSIFRPRVMAVDRLFSWRTPYGVSHDQSLLAELPSALAESAKMAITGALAISSKSTYGAGLLRFSQFCDRWSISESARMPASYALLCAFIGNYKGMVSGKTVGSWISGIRAWHLANHAPWYGDDKWVQMARISANKEGSRHKRPLRAPVSIEHLLALWRAITLSDHFHAAIWAVALVTFFGCRRLGEITVKSITSFNPSFHVLRSAEYVCFFFEILSIFFTTNLLPAVFPSPAYEMAHVRLLSAYPGLKPPAKKVPPSSSLLVGTNFALVRLCRIISPSMRTFREPSHFLRTSTTDAGNT